MNFATARRLVEKHLTDSCRITRDRQGVYDDVLDMATGQLLSRPLAPEVVYDGPCLVRPTAVGQSVEGARVMERKGYAVRLPHDAPVFFRGDRIVVTASADPQLVGHQLTLTDSSQGATMDVGTMLSATDTDPVAAV